MPPRVETFAVDGKVASISTMEYRQDETGRWLVTRRRTLYFGLDGKVTQVHDVDLTGLRPVPTRIGLGLQDHDGLLAGLGVAAKAVCHSLGTLLGPQPLMAQAVPDCSNEETDHNYAVAAASLAAAAAGAAAAACQTAPSIPNCVAAGAAAAAAALAGLYATELWQRVLDCYNDTPQGMPQEGTGGARSYLHESGGSCEHYIVEISYDGGATWNYWDSFSICTY
jgi:hypothetical protein